MDLCLEELGLGSDQNRCLRVLSSRSNGLKIGHEQESCRSSGRNKLGRAVISQPGLARIPATKNVPPARASATIPIHAWSASETKGIETRKARPTRTLSRQPKNNGLEHSLRRKSGEGSSRSFMSQDIRSPWTSRFINTVGAGEKVISQPVLPVETPASARLYGGTFSGYSIKTQGR